MGCPARVIGATLVLLAGAPGAPAYAQEEGGNQCPAGSPDLDALLIPGRRADQYTAATTARDVGLRPIADWRPSTGGCPPSKSTEPAQRPFRASLDLIGIRLVALSHYGSDRDNGSLWTARGLSSQVTASVSSSWGPLRLRIAPQVSYHENREFATKDTARSGISAFSYPWHLIDLPQRPGNQPYFTVHPGVSLTWTAGPVSVEASDLIWTEGPARRYPLILGTTAPGFPHVGARLAESTVGPLLLGVSLMVGRLDESKYFDNRADNDHRQLTVLGGTVGLRSLPDITVGVVFAHHLQLAPGQLARNPLSVFAQPISLGSESSNAEGNGLGSVFVHWSPTPLSEVYAEYGRDDYPWDLWDLLSEPDHSRAFVLGFSNTVPTESGAWVIDGEWLETRTPLLSYARDQPTWYTHAPVTQGHTHRGQLLGASVGPGSDAQYLSVARVGAPEIWGLFLERVRWDDDAYLRHRSAAYGFRGHDVELSMGLRYTRPLGGDLTVDSETTISRRRNRSFLALDGVSWTFPTETNVKLDLTVIWIP